VILKGLTAKYLIRAARVPQPRNNCALQTTCPAAIVSGGLYQWISSAYQSSVATLKDLGGILIECARSVSVHEVFHEKGAAPAGTEAVDHAAAKWKRRKQQIAAMRRWLPKQERETWD
jgi:hypothetical protein